ncbi:phosphotyrosine protein phosphatase [Rhizobium leguminosarum]|uniref:low molecular weight protein tyrosine phosphatase family protein n=1 Tax=Rhizobium leguminosarum TaxID=384 RepID=UPI002E13AD3B|nr:phosphotyrosine protein phosphatase [Rhizobium leguminosarum]
MAIRVLFVCSLNRLRSPTAEEVFSAHPGIETMSAGTDPAAENPISDEVLEWADLVLCMEDRHRRLLNERHGPALRGRRVAVLDVPDRYGFMDPKLVNMLKRKVPRHLR